MIAGQLPSWTANVPGRTARLKNARKYRKEWQPVDSVVKDLCRPQLIGVVVYEIADPPRARQLARAWAMR